MQTQKIKAGVWILRAMLLAALLLVGAYIFSNSQETAVVSSEKSGSISQTLCRIFIKDYGLLEEARQREILSSVNSTLRVFAHSIEFCALGFFAAALALTFRRQASARKIKTPALLFFSFVFSALYALSDEIHQIFIDGRAFEVSDLLTDSGGAVIGILAAWLLSFLLTKAANRRKTADQ